MKLAPELIAAAAGATAVVVAVAATVAAAVTAAAAAAAAAVAVGTKAIEIAVPAGMTANPGGKKVRTACGSGRLIQSPKALVDFERCSFD